MCSTIRARCLNKVRLVVIQRAGDVWLCSVGASVEFVV